MSSLADLQIAPDTIRNAIFQRLNGDATLLSALGASGRIVPGPKAPIGILPPRLHIEMQVAVPDMYTAAQRVSYRLRAVVPNPSRGVQADAVKAGQITARAAYLITGKAVFTLTGYVFFDSWVESFSGLLIDEADPENSFEIVNAVVRCRKAEP